MLTNRLFLVTVGALLICCGVAAATPLVEDFDAVLTGAGLNPASTDGNGNAGGDANGILDSDELAVMSWILADVTRPHHDGVHTAYTTNLARMNADMARNSTLSGLASIYAKPLAAYITLGDAGGFARGAAILAQYSGGAVILNTADYDQTQVGVLAFDADPDGDGKTNLQEYSAIAGMGGPGSAKRAQYITDIFTAPITPVVVDFDAALTTAQLNPATEDSNGPVVGNQLTPNGILDSDELAVLSWVLADTANPFFPAAKAAYQKNLAQMTTDAGPYAGLVATALAGYVTLGDANTVTVVAGILAKFARPFTAAGYDLSQSAVFAYNADPDHDLRTNLDEYGSVTGTGGPGSQKRADYIAAVFTAYQNPNCETCTATTGAVVIGTNVCLAVPTTTGNNFQWYFKNVLLSDGRVSGSQCQWLHISNAQLTDSGVYKCEYNDAAKAAKTYTTTLSVVERVPVGGPLALVLLTGLITAAAALVLLRGRQRA
jgi:hypothetical protein